MPKAILGDILTNTVLKLARIAEGGCHLVALCKKGRRQN
jgi:hypothetical protein